LALYFVYREADDRWLTSKIFPATALKQPEPKRAERPVVPVSPPTTSAESQSLVGQRTAALERRMLETHAAIATAMEKRLFDHIESVHGQYEDQAAVMEQTQRIVGEINDRLRAENLAVASELASAATAMENELLELDYASDDLDVARDAWSRTYRQLSKIGEISGDALNEANYRFETYTVGSQETLTQIASALEKQLGIAGSDLRTLIELFNDIETRLRTSTGRRSPVRVVTNPTLRIPIPRGAGGMIEDSGVSEILNSQREAIEQAQDRQTKLQASIGSQITRMRGFVERLDRLDALSRDLQKSLSALNPTDLSFLGEAANPEQRQAWETFNQAFDAYARLESRELQGAGAERLESAARQLIEAYTTSSAIAPTPSESAAADEDLEWFRTYLERYDPTR